MGVLLGSVGHKVKIHKITLVIEIKDYVVLQKTQEQANDLPPPHTLILDFTMTHTRYGCSIQHTTGQLTHTRCSDGVPESDGPLQKVVRTKYDIIVKFASKDQTQSRLCL